MSKSLDKIYHTPGDPGSLGGVNRLLTRALQLKVPGASRKSVETYLQSQQAYTLHKPARRHYIRNKIYVSGIDAQWQADLADMQGISRQNDGMRYILTVIDVFSKLAWAVPVKSKDAGSVADGLTQVLLQASPRKPKRLQTDKGKEFFNSIFAALMRRHHIHHFDCDSDMKAAVVERFNRTIKSRIYTYLSDRGSVRWVDVLQDLLKAYNASTHRTIGMAPAQVARKHENRLWTKMYGDGDTHLKPVIPKGAMVRLNKSKGVFDKGYMPNWSKEHFQVRDVPQPRKAAKRPIYKLEDYSGDEVKGSWYPEELQAITENQYRIEKVLRRRTLPDGRKVKLVRWEGLPEKFNCWINEEDEYNVAG